VPIRNLNCAPLVQWRELCLVNCNGVPALPQNVGATDEVKFFYESQVPQNAPTYTHGPSVGRLTAQVYGFGRER